jgi:hypothetical protein
MTVEEIDEQSSQDAGCQVFSNKEPVAMTEKQTNQQELVGGVLFHRLSTATTAKWPRQLESRRSRMRFQVDWTS